MEQESLEEDLSEYDQPSGTNNKSPPFILQHFMSFLKVFLESIFLCYCVFFYLALSSTWNLE